MGDVVRFHGVTYLDLPVETILDMARERSPTGLIISGYNADGEFFALSSWADGGEALWALETAKTRLLQAGRILPSEQ